MSYSAANMAQAMPELSQSSVPQILLVEDDASDAMLTEIALDNAEIEYSMRVLKSGSDVLPYLHHERKYYGGRMPDMMLLDLSLPSMDGFEVLAKLAEQQHYFGELPIVILTGDTRCTFLKRSFGLTIAAYLTKPCSPHKIRKVFDAINRTRKH